MSDQLVLASVEQNIGVLRLNRPAARNALSQRMTDELASALETMENNASVKVILLTSSGSHFAAGADVKEMAQLKARDVFLTGFSGCCTQLADFEKPVVAAIEGFALGAGCELIEMCDVVIASSTAKFGHPEITLGTMSGAGGTQRLTKVLGKHWAMDLLLTGRTLSASEALHCGLVSRIVEPEQLQEEAVRICKQIAAYSAPVLKMIKQSVQQAVSGNLCDGVALERRLFHLTFELDDRNEGMAAFLARRPPVFQDK